MYNSTEVLGDTMEGVAAILAIYAVIFLLAGGVRLVLFILQGFGLFEMSKKLNYTNPWLAFVPVLAVYSFGRVAQSYIKRDGNRSAKFGVILTVLWAIEAILLVLFFAFVIAAAIGVATDATTALQTDSQMTAEMFSGVIGAVIVYFILFAVLIANRITAYVALWRIFSVFDNNNATLFTILAIFFPFLSPIFLFVVRKNMPKTTFEERIGIPVQEIEV